mmetsp:Transcript_82768/g.233082  ORF Transcript_82768/g.233082 Transcript_82768/m.233082 type:complete len:361 (-) Transcript_82768:1793-2875(-)
MLPMLGNAGRAKHPQAASDADCTSLVVGHFRQLLDARHYLLPCLRGGQHHPRLAIDAVKAASVIHRDPMPPRIVSNLVEIQRRFRAGGCQSLLRLINEGGRSQRKRVLPLLEVPMQLHHTDQLWDHLQLQVQVEILCLDDHAPLKLLSGARWRDVDTKSLRVLVEPRANHLLCVRVWDELTVAAVVVLPEHSLVPVPICLGIFVELVHGMHRMEQAILERAFFGTHPCRQGEEGAQHHTGGELVLDVRHVDRLIRLRAAQLVHGQKLHHSLVNCLLVFPRVVVDVVPLLGEAQGGRAGRECSEALRIHACRISRNQPAPIAVGHGADLISEVVQLVHAVVSNQAQSFAQVLYVLQLFTAV